MTAMSEKSFLLSISEHFEDWYVVDLIDDIEYSNLDTAIVALKYNFEIITSDKNSMLGIDNFIKNELKFDDFEKELAECDKGICLRIVNEEEEEFVQINVGYNYSDKSKYIYNCDISDIVGKKNSSNLEIMIKSILPVK